MMGVELSEAAHISYNDFTRVFFFEYGLHYYGTDTITMGNSDAQYMHEEVSSCYVDVCGDIHFTAIYGEFCACSLLVVCVNVILPW